MASSAESKKNTKKTDKSSTKKSSKQQVAVLPLLDNVVFPDAMAPLVVQREASVKVLDFINSDDDRVVFATVKNDDIEDLDDVTVDDIYDVGTEVEVHRRITLPDGTIRALVQGLRRVRLKKCVQEEPFYIFEVEELADSGDAESDEVIALHRKLSQLLTDIVQVAPNLPDELAIIVANTDDPAELCHLAASTVRLDVADRQRVLEAFNVLERQKILLKLLGRELELLKLGERIHGEVHDELSTAQREFFLRKQLEQIQEELGDGAEDSLRELRAELDAAGLPDEARKSVDRELARIARTPEQSAEHGVIRNWLEWMAQLPWQKTTQDSVQLTRARSVLDRHHAGLDDVKERILDHLAVAKLTAESKQQKSGAILCFVGPPGVGKTSLGRSIAEAMHREFAQVSVGGVRDEAEVRGHRRTYVGAMPGSVIRAVRDAQSRNPVFVIDEIDKLGSDWRGDPSSAMLEVLDPAQNMAFRDHYLDVPFDLSQALFICTANQLGTIPPALRDRMEVIELEGYTQQEKLEIARKHLVPKQLAAHGLKARDVKIPVKTLRTVIDEYTREAGVRELERKIAALVRYAARKIVEASEQGEAMSTLKLEGSELETILGYQRYHQEQKRRTQRAGVSTGLAVTGAGGDILFVEAAAIPGRAKLTITGQLGSVMEESAQAALTWMRTYAGEDEFFDKHEIHIHVPAGAVPKDGPSAGIAIASALASLWRGVPVRSDVAMTGEVTLHGEVLPVGGIKQKVLAAQRAGIKHVLLPQLNEGAAREIDDKVLKGVTLHFVEHVEEVLKFVLDRSRPARKQKAATSAKR